MQRLVNINDAALREEYEFQLQNLSNTDSAGARGKHRMFISTLIPYIEN